MISTLIRAAKRLAAVAILGGGAMAALTGTAAAQFSNNNKAPIDITGDQFEVFQNEDYSLWTGDVQVVQGEVILTAPELKIFGISGGRFNKVEALGGIRYTNGVETISGRTAVYEEASDTITVTGDVVVVQGRQIMTGERMIYHLDTGKIEFDASTRKRVRGVFFTDDAPSS